MRKVYLLLALWLICMGSELSQAVLTIGDTKIFVGIDTPPANIPVWADGWFSGNVTRGGVPDGTVAGFLSLGRHDSVGTLSGSWLRADDTVLNFSGIFYKGLIVAVMLENGRLIIPCLGFGRANETHFQANLKCRGITLIEMEGRYVASILPHPSGPYSIGVQEVHLVDEGRDEKLTENPDDKREMMLHVWYPCRSTGTGERLTYIGAETFRWLLGQGPIPLFWVPKDAYTFVKTHAFLDAEASEGPFPLIVFSHGYRGYPSMYTAFLEEIASHGFIVAAITHPYIAGITIFPDGRVIELQDLSGYDNDYIQWYFETAFEEMVGDIVYVLDYLENLNDSGWGTCDMSHIGMYGHSFGGGAAATTCRVDGRVKAGLALDSFFRGDVMTEGVKSPFFMFFVEGRFETEDTLQEFWNLMEGDVYRASVAGSAHQDFTDLPILLSHFAPAIPRHLIPGFGEIDGKRLVTIVNTFALAFFNVYLKGMPLNVLLNLTDEFDEVSFYYK